MADISFELTALPLGKAEAPAPPGHGAMVEFLGVVRPEEAGDAIQALDYEAYEPMARRQGMRILEDLAGRHKVLSIHVVHRTGRIGAGEASVRVRVCARHRREAFAACQEFVERLKQDVPIWKTPVR